MLKHSLIALAALGAGLVGFSASEASAFSVPKPVFESDSASSLHVDVNHKKYYWKRHGKRHHRRSHRYRHYHGGYWYDNPWWIFPMVGAGIALSNRDRYYDGYGSNHVEWCLNRYRSYNIRTNTWVSYSGRVHQCISPYGP
jgi:hypothetical protein